MLLFIVGLEVSLKELKAIGGTPPLSPFRSRNNFRSVFFTAADKSGAEMSAIRRGLAMGASLEIARAGQPGITRLSHHGGTGLADMVADSSRAKSWPM